MTTLVTFENAANPNSTAAATSVTGRRSQSVRNDAGRGETSLKQPQEIRADRQREVEQLRHHPHRVNRRRGGVDESKREQQADHGAGSSREKLVGAGERDREQRKVEDDEARRPEHAHERPCEQRVDERFAVEQPRRVGIVRAVDFDERRPGSEMHARDVPPLLQEHTARTRSELAQHPQQILTAVRQIGVRGEGVRHQVVGGFVAEDLGVGATEIGPRNDDPVDRGERDGSDPSGDHGAPGSAGPDGRHVAAFSVRNDRSAARAMCRPVGREWRCRMPYSRSIFLTNESIS